MADQSGGIFSFAFWTFVLTFFYLTGSADIHASTYRNPVSSSSKIQSLDNGGIRCLFTAASIDELD